jgi:hypothetical protein
MCRVPSTSVAVVLLVVAAVSATSNALPRSGERFYRQGLRSDGTSVAARVQGDLEVRSADMPCANCHRRSGWGTAEGPVGVPPVVGSVLFAPRARGSAEMGMLTTAGAGTRPAYTDATLLAAVRDGVDPSGRPLSPTMPRYAVTADDVTALAQHLASLSRTPPPGVAATTIHFATIVGSEVDETQRASMLAVLKRYVTHKNAGTRAEGRRRDRGPWDMRQHYDTYRDWVLHEWLLEGPSSTWPAQIDAHYARQAVFALVGGIAAADWTPVHRFCERHGVPCILPNVTLVPDTAADDSFYSMYFSQGVALEAHALARHVSLAGGGTLMQLSRCATPGAAAAALAKTLLAGDRVAARSTCIPDGRPISASLWRELVTSGTESLVLWLGAGDVATLAALGDTLPLPTGMTRVYVSSTLLGDDRSPPPGALVDRALLLQPYVLPDEFDRHAWRALAWLKTNGIEAGDRRIAVNTLFAATLVAEALTHPRTLESRDYFIERLEHMASRSPMPSSYPAMQLGPGRRFASTTCEVLKWHSPKEPS